MQKIQGGAPNNFLILSKNLDPWIRKVDTVPQPRILPAEQRSKSFKFYLLIAPANIGPGAYVKDNAASLVRGKSKKEVSFGTDQRFKQSEDMREFPGPGNYKDQNKWNKRTYNLKFINTPGVVAKHGPFTRNIDIDRPTADLTTDGDSFAQ